LKNHHISATVRTIATKFGIMTQFEPLHPTVKISKFKKTQDGGCPYSEKKIEKLPV